MAQYGSHAYRGTHRVNTSDNNAVLSFSVMFGTETFVPRLLLLSESPSSQLLLLSFRRLVITTRPSSESCSPPLSLIYVPSSPRPRSFVAAPISAYPLLSGTLFILVLISFFLNKTSVWVGQPITHLRSQNVEGNRRCNAVHHNIKLRIFFCLLPVAPRRIYTCNSHVPLLLFTHCEYFSEKKYICKDTGHA